MRSKEERNIYARDWYLKNKDKINGKARAKIKTKEQRDKHNLSSIKYYSKNKYKRQIYNELNKDKLKAKYKIYSENHKEKIKKYNQEYRLKNKDKLKEKGRIKYLLRKPIIQAKNKSNRDIINEKYRLYIRKRFEIDQLFKLNRRLGSLIRLNFKRKTISKKSTVLKIIGCSYQDFKIYIERQFKPWMNWENHGMYNGTLNYGWDLDHIIPISKAKTEKDIYELNHYTNFQPLDSYINRYIKKGNIK